MQTKFTCVSHKSPKPTVGYFIIQQRKTNSHWVRSKAKSESKELGVQNKQDLIN